jgi:hypothetical protein
LFAAEEAAVCEKRVPGIGFFAASGVRRMGRRSLALGSPPQGADGC